MRLRRLKTEQTRLRSTALASCLVYVTAHQPTNPSQTQMRYLDLSFLPKCRNIIQIRTPIHMLPSWNSNIHANLKEVGRQLRRL